MKQLNLLLLVVLLSSCASMRYGNLTDLAPNKDVYLAQDAVSQLSRVYPPTQNTFYIHQQINDGFGIHLIREMRKKGYGIIENVQARQKANFFYVVDMLAAKPLYRVSLYIGSQTLSRVYAKTRGKLEPVSPWSRKE